jgi:hypothetical protein
MNELYDYIQCKQTILSSDVLKLDLSILAITSHISNSDVDITGKLFDKYVQYKYLRDKQWKIDMIYRCEFNYEDRVFWKIIFLKPNSIEAKLYMELLR